MKTILLAVFLGFFANTAFGWFNDSWNSRRQVALDAGVTGADIQETLADFPLLVRLHTGNFNYFGDLAENGKDIRFMLDDKTPLKHSVEKLDAVNQIALLWVKVPAVHGGASGDSLWMYYGNAAAEDGSDEKGVYDASQSLIFHFAEGQTLPQDATAYGNHAAESRIAIEPAGWIGAAAKFDGQGGLTVSAHPSLAVNPEAGWSFSTWIRLDQSKADSRVFQAMEGNIGLQLVIRGANLLAQFQGAGSPVQTPPAVLPMGQWKHIAVVAKKDQLELYLDGARVGSVAINLATFNPSLTIGGTSGSELIGLLDEVQVSNKARSADWIKLAYRSQSPDFNVLGFGEDEGKGSGGGSDYFVIILQSLTVDGWVVIGLCGVMFVISLLVMGTKGLYLSRARKDNQAFLDQYRGVDASNPGALDQDETDEEREIGESDLLAALVGRHDHFQSSPIYHVYHAGVQELKKRYAGGMEKPLTPEALNVIRARLDAAVVREGQRLNQNMVLLTIAISGGPFLGLLGTVLGVMITFAVIAATGDVNINSIAPGISGALAATVAGLAVAIPALFAYNYLLTQIKDITADMRVFTDEFLAMISERVAEWHRAPASSARDDWTPGPTATSAGEWPGQGKD